MKSERVKELLQQYILNELSEEDKKEFSKILEEPGERELFSALLDEQLKSREFETEEDIPGVYLRLQAVLNKYIKQHRTPVIALIHRRKVYRMLSAAAIILIMVIGVGVYHAANQGTKKNLGQMQYKGDVAPGHNGAALHLSDGRTILLDSAANGVLAMQGKIKVMKENGQISYSQLNDKGHKGEIIYNYITTDKGRQWTVTLPDGTRVWLNALSSIRYPLTFVGNERLVEITGEAYFEVIHNQKQPFRVKVKNQVIEDIGTSFNVNAYNDEPTINTTLVEGSVRVSKGKSSVQIKRGEQVQGTENSLKIVLVDVEQVTAWRRGFFNYHHADIQTVMRPITRWYNVDVKYDLNMVKDKTFTGEIGRDLTLAQVLQGLEKMDVHFKIEDNKRIVILP